MKKFIALTLILISVHCYSQVDREFWFVVPKETGTHGAITAANTVSFKIAAMNLDANVTISMPQNPAFVTRNFIVPAGQSHIEVLATSFAQFQLIYNNNTATGSPSLSDLPGAPENQGFLITSDNDITVYYDYDNSFNRDLFTLKGKNALGTDFYTPFQNVWDNGGAGYPLIPISSIEIVATEDNDSITIYPPPLASPVFKGYVNNNPIKIVLNRGQTFSLVANSQTGALHPAGTHIVSTKKISVVGNDDSVGLPGGCKDIAGDQLVPTSILGSKYVAMCGNRYYPPLYDSERLFVLAIQPNTHVYFEDKLGNPLYDQIINQGEQCSYMIDYSNANNSSVYVHTDDPSKLIYVWQITGIGCEIGGAILPPITNCTGSTEVSFYRALTSSVVDFKVNLMIPYDTSNPFADPMQSYNFFTLYYSDGTPPYPIPGSWFEQNLNSGWAVLKFGNRDFNAIAKAGQAQKIVNTKDFFHLGIVNGTTGATNKYGYFSSFNVSKGGARVASTETTDKIACLGDTVILVAEGGLEYTWTYGAPLPGGSSMFLSDPKSPNPQVFCPVGNHDFFVNIRRSKCYGDTTIHINVKVLAPVKAAFETNITTGCAPLDVVFTNKSVGALNYYWSKKFDSNPVIDFTPLKTPALQYPAIGSLVTRLMPAAAGVPPYVTFQELRNGSAGQAGYLGTAYNPFIVEGSPNQPNNRANSQTAANLRVRGITLPTGFTLEQLENRDRLLQNFEQSFEDVDRNADLVGGLDSFHRQALEILRSTKTRDAFALEREPSAVRNRYGMTPFGQGALAARRLIEAGVRFTTVSIGGWDTHGQTFNAHRSRLLPQLDQTLSALIADLDDRGMLDSTVVYCAGEFGRTPRINNNNGRDHWARSMAVVLAGGGFKRGYVHGSTDTNGMAPNVDPCTPDDVCSTIFTQLGIDPHQELQTPTGRPVQLFREGRAIPRLVG